MSEGVDADLRAAELEIDCYYQSNPLTQLTFGEAAWYFLAALEDHMVRQHVRRIEQGSVPAAHDQATFADELVTASKPGLRWLYASCRVGDVVPNGYVEHAYSAALDLWDLSSRYLRFEYAFTFASMRRVRLALNERRIVPSSEFRKDVRFEAYDRVTDIIDKGISSQGLRPLIQHLSRTVRVKKDRFSYPLNPQLVKATLEQMEPALGNAFHLPGNWGLEDYTLEEFVSVAKVIWVLSAIHFNARLVAAARGCPGLGYPMALVLMSRGELEARLVRYTRLPPARIRSVVATLTFGSGGIRSPDPALQPLVRLKPDLIAWAPSLVLNSNVERNIAVLMNRMESTKNTYSTLSHAREELLRERIKAQLAGRGLRFWNGEIPDWGHARDIDLVIISERERCVIGLELKAFVAPAEPREIEDRSKEVQKGVMQVLSRKEKTRECPAQMLSNLGIDSSYTFTWAVASETSIGPYWVQDDRVPIVRVGHLLQKIVESDGLVDTVEWLTTRSYLPVEGRDYEVADVDVPIGDWTLGWYGIRPLGSPP